jgi:protocatechuate 3,4-dioxygenase, beta subunit
MTGRLTLLVAITLFVPGPALSAQDVEFIRALERTQAERPRNVVSNARIAPPDEAGTPLVIHGRVFAPDGRAPLSEVIVFAYHTDREGHYDKSGSAVHSWRLRGWARSDADGRFEFQTIRPGPYPGRRIPAHVHFTLFLPSGERYHAGELQFEDDELVARADREKSAREGAFGAVQAVKTDGGTQHVNVALKVDRNQKF